MEYEDEHGKTYVISYSQRLQAEDLALKRRIIAIGIAGLVVLIIMALLMGALLWSGTFTKILHNVVC